MDNCSTVLTIPQFTGTCWFNALLMTLLYSDGMRKYLTNNLINSELYTKNIELYRIFMDILKNRYRNINNNDDIFLAELKPENILKILHKADKKTFYFDPDKFSKHFGENYFVRLFEYFGLKKKVLFLAVNTFSENSLNQYVYSKLNTNLRAIEQKTQYNVKFRYKNLTDQQKEKIRNDKNIDILVITQFDYDDRDNSNVIFETSSQDLEEYIVFNGSIYKIDSLLVSNFNMESCSRSHQIAGVTCNNNRYMYNGWLRQTQDPAKQDVSTQYLSQSKACELMKYDWFNNTENFCLSTKACKIENRNPLLEEMCFNTTDYTTYIYVKVDNNDETFKLREKTLKNVEKKCKKELSEMMTQIEANPDATKKLEYKKKQIFCNRHIKEIKTRMDDIRNSKLSTLPAQKTERELKILEKVNKIQEYVYELVRNSVICQKLLISDIHKIIDSYKLSDKITNDMKLLKNKQTVCEILNMIKKSYSLQLNLINNANDNDTKERLIEDGDTFIKEVIQKEVDKALTAEQIHKKGGKAKKKCTNNKNIINSKNKHTC